MKRKKETDSNLQNRLVACCPAQEPASFAILGLFCGNPFILPLGKRKKHYETNARSDYSFLVNKPKILVAGKLPFVSVYH